MPKWKLSAPAKRTFQTASRSAIEAVLRRTLRKRLQSGRWIEDGNRYRRKCIDRVEDDLGGNDIRHRSLSEYIAASAPVHAIDGWSLLGRAVESILRGDAASAIHLAYYAELRAAMSLLASEGVGVFAGRHVVVKDGSKCVQLARAGTHKIVWPCLDYWAALRRSASLLQAVIRVEARELGDWFGAFGSTGTAGAVARKWLRSWGLDLGVLGGDHTHRNEASYRPSEFRQCPSTDVLSAVTAIADMWRLFEPGTAGGFPLLDRFLLRRGLESMYEGETGHSPTAAPADFSARVLALTAALGLNGHQGEAWVRFLTRLAEPADPRPLVLADSAGGSEDADLHLQVLSRAALLLRLATGSARQLLQGSQVGTNDLGFWWRRVGLSRGLWAVGDEPTQLSDLWADVELNIQGAAGWVSAQEDASPAARTWRRSFPATVDDFGSCELIPVWILTA